MSEKSAMDDAAIRQAREAGAKESDSPMAVPTGEMLGPSSSESDRILALMRGEPDPAGNQELGGSRDQPQETVVETLQPSQPQTPESPTLAQLFEQEEAEREEVKEGPSTEDSDEEQLVVRVGDREVPLSTVESWEDSYRNGEDMVREHQRRAEELEQERQNWRESVRLLHDKPLEGLQAIGVTPQQLAEHMKQNGFLAQGESEPTQETLHFDEDTPDYVRQLARQNQQLSEQIKAANSRYEELQSKISQQTQAQKDRQIMEWYEKRLNTAQDYVGGLIDKASDLDLGSKTLLKKAVMAEVRGGLDRAPMDEPGLREWAKGRLKAVMSDVPVDKAAAAVRPKSTTVPVRTGETPRPSNDQPWDKANHFDDDQRRAAAMAWLDHHARS